MKNLTFALLGDPISHSLSPIIYPRLGRSAGVNVTYLAYTATKDEAPALIDRLFTDGIDAVNITSPLKTLFNGANLVVGADAGVRFHNTDADAFRWSYARYISGMKTALIVGTGGVVNGICHVLQDMGMAVTVSGRSEVKPKHIRDNVDYIDFTEEDCWIGLNTNFDVVIWAIPATYWEFPRDLVDNANHVFIDLRYGKLDVWWPAKPENCYNGLRMVIQNAVLALEKVGIGYPFMQEEAAALYKELNNT